MSDDFATPTLPASAATTPDLRTAAHDLAAAASEQARGIKDRATETAQHFRDLATEKAQQLRSAAEQKAAVLRSAAEQKAAILRESASEHWEDTRVKAKEIHVSAEDYIREHPTKCVLGALGVGFLIGLAVRK